MNKEGMFNLVETSDMTQNFQTIDMQGAPKQDIESNIKLGAVSSEDAKQIVVEEPEKLNTINEPIIDTLVYRF
jgi:hypothetical protein